MRWPWMFAVVSGESMAPALRDGDRVLVRRGATLRAGAIVVCRHPERADLLVVKRLAGMPGDTVYGAPLGHGEYWLASDNQLVAPDDSRSFGPVRAEFMVGRLVARIPRRHQGEGSAPTTRS